MKATNKRSFDLLETLVLAVVIFGTFAICVLIRLTM